MEIDLSKIAKNLTPLVGLSGEATMSLRSNNLSVRSGSIMKVMEFLVIDPHVSYNTIVDTPLMNSMQAVPATYHMCLKFAVPYGIETI